MSHDAKVDLESGCSHGSVTSYIIGFALSILITVAAFLIVGNKVFPIMGLYLSITVLALLQLLVQLSFFLHLNFKSEGRWNLMAFIFTLIVVLILVFGSMWIMYSLNYNMMH